jgi:hypothetical protein
VLTDGIAFKDPTSLEDAIEFAQRADSIICTIRFSDSERRRGPIRMAVMAAAKEHGKQDLAQTAAEAGGESYQVDDS